MFPEIQQENYIPSSVSGVLIIANKSASPVSVSECVKYCNIVCGTGASEKSTVI